ncbi:hypothetical protein JHK85_006991 [Glycine max]|nr:hypothetical protein JHK85_006991 [Glycine max]
MNNFGWGWELSPYNQYEEERTPSLESVFEEFMAYHASSKADQTSMKNQELQFGKSYSIEDYQGGPELQPWHQNEAERGSNLDNLLMQFKETTESTQQAFKSAEIQVDKLAEEVTQFVARREEDLVEVEAQEESPVKEHESREKDEEKGEEKVQQWEKYSLVENQQESILQEERQGEQEKTLSVIPTLITDTSPAMNWNQPWDSCKAILLDYYSEHRSLQNVVHQWPVMSVDEFLQKVAWPGG